MNIEILQVMELSIPKTIIHCSDYCLNHLIKCNYEKNWKIYNQVIIVYFTFETKLISLWKYIITLL